MKIELVDIPNDSDSSDRVDYLTIDGEIDLTSPCHYGELHISKKSIEKLGNTKVKDLRDFFDDIHFKIDSSLTDWDAKTSISFSEFSYDKEAPNGYKVEEFDPPLLRISIYADLRSWNKPYSIEELHDLYENEVIKRDKNAVFKSYSENSVGKYNLILNSNNLSLNDVYNFCIQEYTTITTKVIETLENNNYPNIFTTIFEFPENLKTSCKQYLVYFAQFLADIGINADTSIKEEANKVLFTVIPEDDNSALDKIKDALEIYMNAPGFKDLEVFPINEPKDIAVMQWEANIHHLRGQVVLANATLQMKDATIEALQLSNYRLKEELFGTKQIGDKPEEKKEEKIAGGVVTVKKYDGKFFSIDFPEIIKRLKRKKK